MTFIAVQCPHCHSQQIVKCGKTARGTQRYLCQNKACSRGSFLLDYRNRGCLPEVKHLIIDMSLNASGIRDTARSLHVSTDTVLSELKKKEASLELVNASLLRILNPDEMAVAVGVKMAISTFRTPPNVYISTPIKERAAIRYRLKAA